MSESESRQVLEQVIIPSVTKGAVHQSRPVVVVVAGQPGAGKTEIADLVQAALDRRGGAVRIGRDLYKPAHRRYAELLAADVRTAGVKVRPDTSRWQAEVEAHVRACGFDAVVESALADPQEFRASSHAYRRAGHRIEVVAVAVAEAWSQLGILDRFLADPRYVSWENHDTCAQQLLTTLAVVEAEHLADRVTVVRRDGTVLYDNEFADGSWRAGRPGERWRTSAPVPGVPRRPPSSVGTSPGLISGCTVNCAARTGAWPSSATPNVPPRSPSPYGASLSRDGGHRAWTTTGCRPRNTAGSSTSSSRPPT
ncbi:zeta toxin family protein [Streptomyces nogalater]